MEKDTAIKIHSFLTNYFIDSEDPISPPGVKDHGLLESALIRKDMTGGGLDIFEGVYNKAAALFHGIISNHTFYNGNKRTALMSTLVYLGENGYWLTKCDDEEMFEFTRKIAAHELTDNRDDEIKIIAEWLRTNSRRREIRDKRMSLMELKDSLNRFDFEIPMVKSKSNCLDIVKDGVFITSIRHKGANGAEDYDVKYIKGLRRRLKLTPDYGIDSMQFYGEKGFDLTINEHMKIRNKVMRWLAKI